MSKKIMWANAIRGLMAALLCVLLVEQPVLAAPVKPVKHTGVKAQQLTDEQKALHALNRFTFGPRPGDVAAVQAMGLRKWFEAQLNPSSIDDSALDARLAAFPAMKMQQAELLYRYPGPQVLRQIIDGRMQVPAEPLEHTIYTDQIAFYKARQKQNAGQGDDPSGKAEKAVMPGADVDPSTPSMAVHEEQFYSGQDAIRVINLPPEQRMQRILAMSPEELKDFRQSLNPKEFADAAAGLTPEQREILTALQGSPRMIDSELLQSRMLRDIYSERQLEAVMTDFWLNHFNVFIRKNQGEPSLLPAYERDVIRPNALGKFEDLLIATAKSPAMLMYLDNWQSIGPDSQAAKRAAMAAQRAQNSQTPQAGKDRGLNENYARELMELHTLGVQCEVSMDHPATKLDKVCGKGYTQQDVTQVAKVLSGWTIDQPYRTGAYRFEERRHEPGSKTVLGATIQENGEAEGLQVLHMLATSPATAKFISTKLAVRFVSDAPPPALVDRMAKAFVASDGDIKTVLRTLFDSPEFWSPEIYRAKVKTPEEFVISAVRAGGLEVGNALPLTQALNKLGMPLYGMQTPNGYSWMSEPWVNTGDLVSRMNFALALSGGRVVGSQTDWPKLLGAVTESATQPGVVLDAREKEKRLEWMLLGEPVSDRTRDTVLDQFQSQTAQEQAEKNFGIQTLALQDPMDRMLNARLAQEKPRPPQDREAAMMAGLLLGSPEFQRR